MLNEKNSSRDICTPKPGGGTPPAAVLVVGLSGADLPTLPEGAVPRAAHLHFVTSLGALEQDVLRELRPALIVSPLICRGYDAHELARRLKALDFGGVLRVLAPALPRPDMLRLELGQAAPGLQVDVHILP